jgi:hypothetical protein
MGCCIGFGDEGGGLGRVWEPAVAGVASGWLSIAGGAAPLVTGEAVQAAAIAATSANAGRR